MIAMAVATAGVSYGQAFTVPATADIYAANGNTALPASATAPFLISVPVGATSVTFTSVTGNLTSGCASGEGCISMTTGFLGDPDGNGEINFSATTGTNLIGPVAVPVPNLAGFLAGVFVVSGGPSGAAGAANLSVSPVLTAYTPAINQAFFIGDGRTGSNSGSVQTFAVPAGAATLYLGMSDACSAGLAPNCYNDNSGTLTGTATFTVPTTPTPSPTPVPPSILLTLIGLAGGAMYLGFTGFRLRA